jgi:hypothetical protein
VTVYSDAWMRSQGLPTHTQVAHLSTLPGPPDPSRDPAPKPACTCDDPELDRLRELIGGGMGQWEASRLLWPDEQVPKRWRRRKKAA